MRMSDWSSDVCSSDLDADQLAVAIGQRAQRQAAAEPVESLAIRQHAVVDRAGDDALALDALDLELHHAVVEQQDVAGRQVLRQRQVAHADLGRVAGRRVDACDQVETTAGAPRDRAVRSEERSGGKECVRWGRSRWWACNKKKK